MENSTNRIWPTGKVASLLTIAVAIAADKAAEVPNSSLTSRTRPAQGAATLAGLAGAPGCRGRGPVPNGGPGPSNAKAKRSLGWQPRYAGRRDGLRDGLAQDLEQAHAERKAKETHFSSPKNAQICSRRHCANAGNEL
jgi:hypothetical protein